MIGSVVCHKAGIWNRAPTVSSGDVEISVALILECATKPSWPAGMTLITNCVPALVEQAGLEVR